MSKARKNKAPSTRRRPPNRTLDNLQKFMKYVAETGLDYCVAPGYESILEILDKDGWPKDTLISVGVALETCADEVQRGWFLEILRRCITQPEFQPGKHLLIFFCGEGVEDSDEPIYEIPRICEFMRWLDSASPLWPLPLAVDNTKPLLLPLFGAKRLSTKRPVVGEQPQLRIETTMQDVMLWIADKAELMLQQGKRDEAGKNGYTEFVKEFMAGVMPSVGQHELMQAAVRSL